MWNGMAMKTKTQYALTPPMSNTRDVARAPPTTTGVQLVQHIVRKRASRGRRPE